MSKTKKTFIYLAFISMLCVLASCSSDGGSGDRHSGGNAATVFLSCTNLQTSVMKGGTIAKPNLICSNNRTATDPIWNGLPEYDNWEVDPSTYAPDFVISVSAFCGSVELEDVPCGTVEVIEAVSSSSRAGGSSNSAGTGSSSSVAGGSSSSRVGGSSSSVAGGSSSSAGTGLSSSGAGPVLTCTGLQATVAKGGTIAIPTLACTNDATPTDITWTGRPSGATATSWPVSANTQSTSYTISVNATCGSAGSQSGVRCGTVNIVAAGSSSSRTGGSSSSVGGNSSSSVGGSSSSSVGLSSSSSAGESSSSSVGLSSSSSDAVSSSSSDAASSSSSDAVSSSSSEVAGSSSSEIASSSSSD